MVFTARSRRVVRVYLESIFITEAKTLLDFEVNIHHLSW